MKTVRYSSLIMNFYTIGKQNTGIDPLHPQTAYKLKALPESLEAISRYRQKPWELHPKLERFTQCPRDVLDLSMTLTVIVMIRQWFYAVHSSTRRNNTASIVHHLDTNDPMRYIIGHSNYWKSHGAGYG